MSNRNKHISYTAAAGWMDISVPPDMEVEFKKMVQRATSTWQDMSPEMRDFADRVLGVESIMGQNMKSGHSSNTSSPPDTVGALVQQSNVAWLSGVTWGCFWNTGCANTYKCKQAGACCAVTMFKETEGPDAVSASFTDR